MRAALGIVFVAALAACAQVGRPPGGPVDNTPPAVVTTSPGSLAVAVTFDEPLVFEFSEKIDRRGFAASLSLIPAVPIADPKVDGAFARIRPLEGWPADTVVVWTLARSLKDRHGVGLETPLTGAFTTAPRFPSGAMEGSAGIDDEEADLTSLAVHLSLYGGEESRRKALWRRGVDESGGNFRLPWLTSPSGPFHLRAWLDTNGNDQRDEREPVAELDSLFLAAGDSMLSLGKLELVDLEGPVEVRACWSGSIPDTLARIVVFEPLSGDGRAVTAPVDSTGCATRALVPGTYRVGGWLDAGGDGRFGPDSLQVSEPFLEPVEWEIEPARPDTFLLSDAPLEQLPWAAMDTLRPPPVPRDFFPK